MTDRHIKAMKKRYERLARQKGYGIQLIEVGDVLMLIKEVERLKQLEFYHDAHESAYAGVVPADLAEARAGRTREGR